MLLLFFSILVGGATAFWLVRQSFATPPGQGLGWRVLAGVALVGIPLLGLLGGALVVRWFGVCRGQPPTLEDLRAGLRSRQAHREP